MNNLFRSLIATASVCLIAPLAATAQEYRVVYDGTITAGADVDNLFGLSYLPSLQGLAFGASVSYSTSVPGTRVTTSVSDEVTGGFNFGADPVVSLVSFSIGGQSFSFSPDYYSDVYTSPTLLSTSAIDLLGTNFLAYFSPDGGRGPSLFGIPFSGAGTGDTGGAVTQNSYLIAGQDDIDFNATRVTVSAVPEVATWAMLVAGFGAVGFFLRRRERRSLEASKMA
jgi:hypothetical protein